MSTPTTSLAEVFADMGVRDAVKAAAKAAALTAAAAAKNNSVVAAKNNNAAVLLSMLEQKHGQMWIIKDFDKLEGRYIGSGKCPGIVQTYGGLPRVRNWLEGPRVKGNPVIPCGTAIATFVNGKYPNLQTGNHTAIYVDQHPVKGVLIFDQWKFNDPTKQSKPAGYRWVPFGDGRTNRSNDGTAFSIILTRKGAAPSANIGNAILVPET